MSKDIYKVNDNELEKVTGGMKVVVEEKEEELSWWETMMNLLFKIKG